MGCDFCLTPTPIGAAHTGLYFVSFGLYRAAWVQIGLASRSAGPHKPSLQPPSVLIFPICKRGFFLTTTQRFCKVQFICLLFLVKHFFPGWIGEAEKTVILFSLFSGFQLSLASQELHF